MQRAPAMGAIIDKIKGKLMKAEGRATGDKVRTAQGHVEEKKGQVKSAVKSGVRKAKMKVKTAKVRAKAAKAKVRRKAAAAKYMP
jgi:uncharacterized protein YjbJ (UPF0337 family)